MNNIKLIKQLYVELYEAKISPQNLLENLNLENYISVNFSKKGSLLIGTTKCYLEDASISEYFYTFEGDKLIKLEEKNSNSVRKTLYDRALEIQKIRKQLLLEHSVGIC